MKIGDRVLCLDASGCNGKLLNNGIYIIADIDTIKTLSTNPTVPITLVKLGGNYHWWNAARFKVLEEPATASSSTSAYLSETLPNVRSDNNQSNKQPDRSAIPTDD